MSDYATKEEIESIKTLASRVHIQASYSYELCQCGLDVEQ